MLPVNKLLCYGLVVLFAISPAGVCSSVAQQLGIQTDSGGFVFDLVGGGADETWVLQHSLDAADWEALAYFDRPVGDDGSATARVEIGELPKPAGSAGFFRAVRSDDVDVGGRRAFLDNLRLWRRAAPDRYQYQIRESGGGGFSWTGVITVSDGVVEEAVFSEVFPPFVEPGPATIEALFDRVGNALAQNAETVDVTWDRTFGFPADGFIDLDLMIADEEQSWVVDWLVGLPGEGAG